MSNPNSNNQTTGTSGKLKVGIWGGEHVRAEVTDRGIDFEFDCANGKIPKSVVLDSQGRFNVDGTFATEHAGPVLRDDAGNSRSVRYSGAVTGDDMTLTIRDSNTKEDLGTFTLTHGNEPQLRKCR